MNIVVAGRLEHGPWDDPEWLAGHPERLLYPELTPGEAMPGFATGDLEDTLSRTFSSGSSRSYSPGNRGEGSQTLRVLPPFRMLATAYRAAMDYLLGREPEAGGMLLGPKGSTVVTHFVPDADGHATAASFTLNATNLNRLLRQYLDCGLDAKGLIHSHPAGCTSPSHGDLVYVQKLFGNPKNKGAAECLLPIVCDGELFPYILKPQTPPSVQLAQLVLV